MSGDPKKRIFISHAEIDTPIGEKFLDALIELGIDKSEVFFTSNYHTGVRLGNDFFSTIKDALKECEIVVFLITRNFYRSEFCLNEMGAVWISDKPFIPILLDGLTYDDMKGFIDSHYIALKPSKNESYKLLNELIRFAKYTDFTVLQHVFDDFIATANKMAEKTAKIFPNEKKNYSEIDKMILNSRFTDGELLLLNYFVEIGTTFIGNGTDYDYETQKAIESDEEVKIKLYAKRYNFDYAKAKFLLCKSSYISNSYSDDEDYMGFELKIDIFRDLLSLSSEAKSIIESVKAKYQSAVFKGIQSKNNEIRPVAITEQKNHSEIEDMILSPKFKEIEALLFQYMIDTTTTNLGDRWMADAQKSNIRRWEMDKALNDKLSSNYESALRSVIYRKLFDVASLTSYGNPREYQIKNEYFKQMNNLSSDAQSVLNSVISKNTMEPELPF